MLASKTRPEQCLFCLSIIAHARSEGMAKATTWSSAMQRLHLKPAVLGKWQMQWHKRSSNEVEQGLTCKRRHLARPAAFFAFVSCSSCCLMLLTCICSSSSASLTCSTGAFCYASAGGDAANAM